MTTPSEVISPLRQRMMDDMRMRRLAPKTQAGYPSATSGAMPRMNAIVSACTDRLSALRQREPIGDAYACRFKRARRRRFSQLDSARRQCSCRDHHYVGSYLHRLVSTTPAVPPIKSP